MDVNQGKFAQITAVCVNFSDEVYKIKKKKVDGNAACFKSKRPMKSKEKKVIRRRVKA